MDLLERPPHRLDVGRVHRAVRVGGVDPVAHPLGHLLEGVDVPQHGLPALGVELRDAVLLDVGLAGEAELLLDGELDGQAVAVPAGLPLDQVALHRLEPREDVLEDAGLDVVGAGAAVRGRRALVERPARAVAGAVQGLVEGLVLPPEVEHLVLEGGEVHLGWDGAVLAHGWSFGVASTGCGAEGTRRSASAPAAPAVPPSLAARCCWAALSCVTAAGSTCRSPGGRALFRRLRGDLRSGQHPRAHTVPGSLSAVLGATRPVHAVRCFQSARRDPAGSPGFAPPASAQVGRSGKLPHRGRAWLSAVRVRHILAARVWRTSRPATRSLMYTRLEGAARHGTHDSTQAGRLDRGRREAGDPHGPPPRHRRRPRERPPPAKATAAKKAPAKKAAAKKAPAKKAPAKKAPAKKAPRQEDASPRRRPRKKAHRQEGARRRRPRPPRRRPRRRPPPRRRPTPKKAAAQKAPATKTASKKTAATKASATQAPVKKTAAKTTAAKKAPVTKTAPAPAASAAKKTTAARKTTAAPRRLPRRRPRRRRRSWRSRPTRSRGPRPSSTRSAASSTPTATGCAPSSTWPSTSSTT